MYPVTLSDLSRSKCHVPPHSLGLHALPDRDCLLYGCGSWVLQNLRTSCNTSLIMGSLTGMEKKKSGTELSADTNFFLCVSYFSFLHPVLLSMYLQPQSLPGKNLHSSKSASQYVGKEKRTDSTLEGRCLPGHYSHSFVEAGLISLQALIRENCLEKISGPRLQDLVSWQIQLSP